MNRARRRKTDKESRRNEIRLTLDRVQEIKQDVTDRVYRRLKEYEDTGLTPELLRVLQPGRVAAIHVKDRVLFGNATGTGMPTIEPFHADCISHYKKHGFQYFGMITGEVHHD